MNFGEYNYIVVGAGVFGATVAERLAERGKKVLVLDRREHVAGNAYSYADPETGVEIHKYGSHIFHTEDDRVWEYITRFTDFNDYVHTVSTRHEGRLFPMPINLDTVNLLYGTEMLAEEAEEFVHKEALAATRKMALRRAEERGVSLDGLSGEDIERLVAEFQPQNFDEQGRFLVGDLLYETFLKGYTEKQWNAPATEISADILKRIPVRWSTDDRYFITAKHQGIPVNGYGKMVEKMLEHPGITVKLGVEFKSVMNEIPDGTPVVYCGQVDELLDYQFGVLPYRSLKFEGVWVDEETGEADEELPGFDADAAVSDSLLQKAVINEADTDVPYTRTHYYKYYQIHQPEVIQQPRSYACREYPANFEQGGEAYYPVNNAMSDTLYGQYVELLNDIHPNYVLGGRLGAYKYWDMDVAIRNALDLAEKLV